MAAFQAGPTLRPRVALIHKNELAFIDRIDAATSTILGWRPVVGHRTLEFIDPEDHPDAISSWMDMQRVPGSRRQQRRGGLSRSSEWQ